MRRTILHYFRGLILVACFPWKTQSFLTRPLDHGGDVFRGRFPSKPVHTTTTSLHLSDESTDWMQSLRARQLELDKREQKLATRLKSAKCSGGVAAVLPDWVRRLDVNYPLLACGSASGSIFVVDLARGGAVIAMSSPKTTIGQTETEENEESSAPDEKEPEKLVETLRYLYGSYDGGGTIAVAFSGTLICDAGRSGGVKLWRLNVGSGKLVSQGSILALEGIIVTCLHLDEEYLYVATANGRLQTYSLDDDLPLALQQKPADEWLVGSLITSMHINSVLGCAVVTTAKGTIELVSFEDDSNKPMASFMPPFDSMERRASNAFCLSCTIVNHSTEQNSKRSSSIVCGGNDGSLYMQPLELDDDGQIKFERPFQRQIRQLSPRHMAAVKCLGSPAPGLLISCGQDSAMKVWDIDKSLFLYQFVGYKVWIGSLWTDGYRIISDGVDNTVIMHDFTDKNETIALDR